MAVIVHLVRHGEAAAPWQSDADPGLSDQGHAQAREAALRFKSPLPLICSPMRRARETAAAFEALWQCRARVDVRISEIPSHHVPLSERDHWLASLAGRRWSELEEFLLQWRAGVIDCVYGATEESVFVSHFVAISTILGWLQGEERLIPADLPHASCTTVSIAGGSGTRP
jgi:broad specificity phosphatase PhoE